MTKINLSALNKKAIENIETVTETNNILTQNNEVINENKISVKKPLITLGLNNETPPPLIPKKIELKEEILNGVQNNLTEEKDLELNKVDNLILTEIEEPSIIEENKINKIDEIINEKLELKNITPLAPKEEIILTEKEKLEGKEFKIDENIPIQTEKTPIIEEISKVEKEKSDEISSKSIMNEVKIWQEKLEGKDLKVYESVPIETKTSSTIEEIKVDKTDLFHNYTSSTKKVELTILERIKKLWDLKYIKTNKWFVAIIIIITVVWVYFLSTINPYISVDNLEANILKVKYKIDDLKNSSWKLSDITDTTKYKNNLDNIKVSTSSKENGTWKLSEVFDTKTEIQISTSSKESNHWDIKNTSSWIVVKNNSWNIEKSNSWSIEVTNIWWYKFEIKKVKENWVDVYVYKNKSYPNFIELNNVLKSEIQKLKKNKVKDFVKEKYLK